MGVLNLVNFVTSKPLKVFVSSAATITGSAACAINGGGVKQLRQPTSLGIK